MIAPPLVGDPVMAACELLNRRWLLHIVVRLAEGPMRVTHLIDGVPGMGSAMLAVRLRELEELGYIERTAQSYRVRYVALTTAGRRRLAPLVAAIRELAA